MPLSPIEYSLDSRVHFLGVSFDLLPLEDVLARLRGRTVSNSFEYVRHPQCRSRCSNSTSAPISCRSIGTLGCRGGATAAGCAPRTHAGYPDAALGRGTNVMERVFASVLRPGDPLLAFVANGGVLESLERIFPQYHWTGTCPPVGFESEPGALAALVQFAVDHPSRFVFIGVGAPRSEILAARIANLVAPGALRSASGPRLNS